MSRNHSGSGPRFGSVLISITEACPVGCAHCGLRGAARTGEAAEESVLRWQQEALDYGVPRIIFTGGEPFLRYSLLCRAIEAASKHGGETAVFTSAYWSSTFDTAFKMLSSMRGLNTLYISTDIYHQAKIPYTNIYNAIESALKLDIEVILCITYNNENDLYAVRDKYRNYSGKVRFYESRVIEDSEQWPGMDGGSFLPSHAFLTEGKCFAATPLVDSHGNLYTCHIGKASIHKQAGVGKSPFYLGDLEKKSFLDLMSDAQNRPDYQFLRAFGAKGVASFLEEQPDLGGRIQAWGFSNACDMCFKCLSSDMGQRAFSQHVNHEDVRGLIDLHLSLNFGEAPLASE